MKIKSSLCISRRLLIVPLTLLLLLLAGCLEKRLVWAPDGSTAAVITEDGLYLSDAEGKLSPMLANVYLAAWLSDSRQLVVARKTAAAKWAPIAQAAGAERADAIISESEEIWKKLQSGSKWGLLTLSVTDDTKKKLQCIYLRERYGDALRAKVDADEWDEISTSKIDVHELVMAKFDGEKITAGTQLYEGLGDIIEIRLAPADRAVAFTTEYKPDKVGLCLQLARANGSGATMVAEHVTAFPDWTSDGRSLVYVQASGAGSSDAIELGVVVRREVLNADFQIAVADHGQELAGLALTELNRVRCLRDGRIIFNAVELQLPMASEDFSDEHEQLFAIDPARQPTLVRLIPRKRMENLPQSLAFFEVSPDEKQILFGDFNGAVSLLTLATGEVSQIQSGGKKDDKLRCAPSWRAPGEFSYAKRNSLLDGKRPARAAEAVLRTGEKEKVLSATWSDAMNEGLFGK